MREQVTPIKESNVTTKSDNDIDSNNNNEIISANIDTAGIFNIYQ